MKHKAYLLVIALLPLLSLAGENVWEVKSHSLTSSTPVTTSARLFTGELDAIHVYLPAGVTSTVQVAAVDPYQSTRTLLLATNAATVSYRVFHPREVMSGSTTGMTARVAGATGDRFALQGETLRATISDSSTTNALIRFRAIFK